MKVVFAPILAVLSVVAARAIQKQEILLEKAANLDNGTLNNTFLIKKGTDTPRKLENQNIIIEKEPHKIEVTKSEEPSHIIVEKVPNVAKIDEYADEPKVGENDRTSEDEEEMITQFHQILIRSRQKVPKTTPDINTPAPTIITKADEAKMAQQLCEKLMNVQSCEKHKVDIQNIENIESAVIKAMNQRGGDRPKQKSFIVQEIAPNAIKVNVIKA